MNAHSNEKKAYVPQQNKHQSKQVQKSLKIIHCPILHNFRLYQKRSGVDISRLSDLKMGYVDLEVCRLSPTFLQDIITNKHFLYCVTTFCPICRPGHRSINFGCYRDLESALLIFESHKLIHGHYKKLKLLNRQDRSMLHALSVERSRMHNGCIKRTVFEHIDERVRRLAGTYPPSPPWVVDVRDDNGTGEEKDKPTDPPTKKQKISPESHVDVPSRDMTDDIASSSDSATSLALTLSAADSTCVDCLLEQTHLMQLEFLRHLLYAAMLGKPKVSGEQCKRIAWISTRCPNVFRWGSTEDNARMCVLLNRWLRIELKSLQQDADHSVRVLQTLLRLVQEGFRYDGWTKEIINELKFHKIMLGLTIVPQCHREQYLGYRESYNSSIADVAKNICVTMNRLRKQEDVAGTQS